MTSPDFEGFEKCLREACAGETVTTTWKFEISFLGERWYLDKSTVSRVRDLNASLLPFKLSDLAYVDMEKLNALGGKGACAYTSGFHWHFSDENTAVLARMIGTPLR